MSINISVLFGVFVGILYIACFSILLRPSRVIKRMMPSYQMDVRCSQYFAGKEVQQKVSLRK